MILQINGLSLDMGEKEEILADRVAFLLGLDTKAILSLVILRRSLDARRSRPPRWVYLLEIRLAEKTRRFWDHAHPKAGITVAEVTENVPMPVTSVVTSAPVNASAFRGKPVIIGSGPAGLFAALTMAKRGIPVILLERGAPVGERLVDVERFWDKGVLNAESNVCFGEGGAGTFSDGKLTSRVKNPLAAEVKKILVDRGAPAEILVDAHPHIGTDRLRLVVENIRKNLIESGCDVRFHSHVTDFIVHNGRISGVVVNQSEEIMTRHVILATGQAAGDTYRKLAELGVAMEPKAFAMGLRVEHPQELINRIQYGRWAGHPDLPPAEYFLTANIKEMNRSVYSFCMCPGGSVVGCSEAEGGLVTNGMSFLKREGDYANSAVVVSVRPEDLGSEGPLTGLAFRRHWEEAAFTAGGANYTAPVQRMVDFMTGTKLSPVGRCSYRPGIREADLSHVLPAFVVEALKRGFMAFEKKMPGFVTEEAILIGVETRTSSPIRIIRGTDGQSVAIKGVFPCGEGSGYAGGIISSALDGIKAAENAIAAALNPLS